MRLDQIAAQLYTVRDHCQTAAELAATARKLRAIGYPAVQLSGLGPIPEEEILRILSGEGLALCATHEPSDELLNQPERSIARLQRLGCTLTAYAWPAGIDFTSAASIASLVTRLRAAGDQFHAAGLTLGYHNHAIEFVRHQGAPVLEHIFQQTAAHHVVGELDTYWIHYGGGDVIDWCRKLRGRLPFIHLKDYGFTPQNVPEFRELGQGSLPFARIIAEAEASGCRWFIVEQDTCPGDPFESLRISYQHLATLAV